MCQKNAGIIDVGGGDSLFVDFLINLEYTNLTLLDISGKVLERARHRLGDKAKSVKWIESDIRDFSPSQHYEIWHDRAAFHFLTAKNDISTYVKRLNKNVNYGVILGTF